MMLFNQLITVSQLDGDNTYDPQAVNQSLPLSW